MKLTSKEIATLIPSAGKSDALYFDDSVPGLALRVRASGKRSWIFQFGSATSSVACDWGPLLRYAWPRFVAAPTRCTLRLNSDAIQRARRK